MALDIPAGYLRGTNRDTAAKEAARLYAQGCTIRSVARELDRSYGCARDLLLHAGVTLRPKGIPTRRKANA